MSTQNIVIAVIVVGFIGAAGWWIVNDPVGDEVRNAVDSVPASETQDEIDSADGEELPSGMGRLLELYERGTPMECTFSYSDVTGSGEGSSFFDGERMRISVMFQENDTNFVSDIINDGETMYMWGEAPEGEFAVQMAATEDNIMEMEDEFDEAAALNEEVAYDCRTWSVDSSVFNPPADVEFMDMGAMMEQMMQGFGDMEGMDPDEMEAMMEEMMQGMPQ